MLPKTNKERIRNTYLVINEVNTEAINNLLDDLKDVNLALDAREEAIREIGIFLNAGNAAEREHLEWEREESEKEGFWRGALAGGSVVLGTIIGLLSNKAKK